MQGDGPSWWRCCFASHVQCAGKTSGENGVGCSRHRMLWTRLLQGHCLYGCCGSVTQSWNAGLLKAGLPHILLQQLHSSSLHSWPALATAVFWAAAGGCLQLPQLRMALQGHCMLDAGHPIPAAATALHLCRHYKAQP